MSADSKRRTRLLDDRPTERDEFAIGSTPGAHSRVVDAIVELIADPDSKGTTIGLEGRWGAGKSSILKMVAAQLLSSERAVITFDAWAHEGDPLRRTFLEALTAEFIERAFIDPTKWNDRLLELTGKKRREETTTSRRLKPLGLFFALSVTLVPLGTALATGALNKGATLAPQLERSLSWQLLLGALMSVAPVIVAAANALRLLRKERRQPEDWDFTQQSTTTNIVSLTTETPEPTSIEFESCFSELIRDALAISTRQVVLVLDNLDRVEADAALRLWSAMQAFLQDRHTKEQPWHSRLWVVVPFDVKGLSRIWQGPASTGPDEVAWSFIDKTFPVRFTVPPPALSNWRAFLLSLLRQAFPDHEERALERVYRAFESHRPQADRAPTPRELKRFVNDLGSVHRQWSNAFALEQMAYFALRARHAPNLQSELLHGGEPTERAIALLGNDLPSTMAALWFNVPSEQGQQLLLRTPTIASLREANVEGFVKLVQDHGERFWVVMESTARSGNVGGETLQGLVNAARCIGDERLSGWRERSGFEDVRQALCREAKARTDWDLADKLVALGTPGLLRLLDDPLVTSHVFREAQWTPASLATLGEGAPKWVAEQCISMLTTASKLGHQEALQSGVRTELKGLAWIAASSEIRKLDPSGEYWRCVMPAESQTQILTGLEAGILAGQDTTGFADALALCAREPSFSATSIIQTIEKRFDPANNASEREFRELLSCLESLRPAVPQEVDALFARLAVGGQLLHFVHVFTGTPDLSALCIAEFLTANPAATQPPAIGQSAAGYNRLVELLAAGDDNFAATLLEQLQGRRRLDVLISVPRANGAVAPLVSASWRLVAKKESAFVLFTAAVILDNWHYLKNALSSDFGEFISRAIAAAGLCEHIMSGLPNGLPPGPDDGLAIEILRVGATPQAFLAWCGQGLQGLSREEWLDQLTRRGSAVDRLIELAAQDAVPQLPSAFSDALGDHAEALRKEQITSSGLLPESWATVIAGTGTWRLSFHRKLMKEAARSDGKGATEFLRVYGTELLAAALAAEDSATEVRDLLEPCLAEMQGPWLEWLVSLFRAEPGYLDRSRGSAASMDFKTRLKQSLAVGGPNKALLEEIGRAVGVDAEPTLSEGEPGR